MPRGSLPGERRGGRRRGTPNKATVLKAAALAAAAAANASPLEFILGVMRDERVPVGLRMAAAKAAAQYCHAKQQFAVRDPADNAKLIEGTVDSYGVREERADLARLHQLHCKTLSPRGSAGGSLTEAETAELVAIKARVSSYDRSEESISRRRILDLSLKEFSRDELTAEERTELQILSARYPPDLDPSDPLYPAFEAWRPEPRREYP
jgi:hypothetical protein